MRSPPENPTEVECAKVVAHRYPAWGNRTMRVERFEEAWIDSPQIVRVGFVVARRDGGEVPIRLAPRASDFVMLR
jgi:uncharacterized protein